jgi:hypothetical protein
MLDWMVKGAAWQLAEAHAAMFPTSYHNRLHVGVLLLSGQRVVPLSPDARDALRLRARYCPSDMLRLCDARRGVALSSPIRKCTAAAACPVASDMCVICFNREGDAAIRYYVCTNAKGSGLPLPPWSHDPVVHTRRVRNCGVVLPDGTRVDLTKEYKTMLSPADSTPPNTHAHIVLYLIWQTRHLREHQHLRAVSFSDCRFWMN